MNFNLFQHLTMGKYKSRHDGHDSDNKNVRRSHPYLYFFSISTGVCLSVLFVVVFDWFVLWICFLWISWSYPWVSLKNNEKHILWWTEEIGWKMWFYEMSSSGDVSIWIGKIFPRAIWPHRPREPQRQSRWSKFDFKMLTSPFCLFFLDHFCPKIDVRPT